MAMTSMTDAEFALFQRKIQQETGIHLPDEKKALLHSRLNRRLRRLEIDSYTKYYEIVGSSEEERVAFVDAVCTNETSFFREPRQFDFLRTHWIPEIRKKAESGQRTRQVRIWSAGCSTGEEPYSLSMLLSDLLPRRDGWDVQIVATDISSQVLDAAREGIWPIARAKDIPDQYLRRFMLRGVRSQSGSMKAGAETREAISFGRVNLMSERYPFDEPFDLILCRNVMIYFDHTRRTETVRRLFENLSDDGYLLLGHAETLNGVYAGARTVTVNIYAK